ncbi:2,3-diaminopropionate biosynthesis protein SbnB [Streptomyces sp. NRRL B-1677]|uniref:2,3-diaminopropionate biosynthesis protein SbnB n=1 Tax=Streptomyces klenkii TaxID=1420899 RepID=A0A3B0BEH3_9ACTN|nr:MULTISPECIES: 2,3-diaminopropionate biosynthesis protein SbnB [Streptomyces]MBF6047583.1 2,3-diaminopropionate biosynthesis protein SbnB [Streptomyces sp. NRRL B-1677]RKN71615.1 2,3-diaminopropionate biosynthesis protein SbnB [Streptomyces klenkii]
MTDQPPPPMTFITASQVAEQIEGHRPECADVVRRAYLAHDAGDSSNPHSSFLRFPDEPRNRIIALPARLGGEFGLSGIKWIASYPENTRRGIPRASAVLILNDAATGFPYVCMEASLISATRTAASAVVAAEALLGGRSAQRVGFVGTGLIAGHVRRFLRDLGWRIGGYRLFDLDAGAAGRFARDLADDGAVDVRVTDGVRGAFAGCDLVVLATVAGEPHLHDPALLAHAPVVLHLSLRDLAPGLILRSQNLTDDPGHAVRERTSLHLAAEQAGHREFLHGTVAGLLRGRARRDAGRASVFSPFGLGILDLAVGGWVHDRLAAAGGSRPVAGFFPAPAQSGAAAW